MSVPAASVSRPFAARLRRYFAGPVFGGHRRLGSVDPSPSSADKESAFHRQARQFTASQFIVRGFYAFMLYYAVTQCGDFPGLTRRINFNPLWPVAWMSHVPGEWRVLSIVVVEALYVIGSVFGAFFASWRAGRLLAFLAVLEYVAFRNSLGKIGHSLHLFVTVALILIFLPRNWQKPAADVPRRTRHETLLVFWLCQAAILMSYSMSGLAKFGAGIGQLAVGQMNAFSPGAVGAHIAQRLVQTNTHSLLGDFIIDHPWLTWPMMPAAIYLELFAFWIVFRPAVQRWWALVLIVFHIGTFFTMTITFPVSCLLLALFFFQSPFQPSTVRWREIVGGLPLVDEVLNLPSALRRLGVLGKAK